MWIKFPRTSTAHYVDFGTMTECGREFYAQGRKATDTDKRCTKCAKIAK